MYHKIVKGIVVSSLMTVAPLALADAGSDIAQTDCAGCHALSKPDYEKLGMVERESRKAPPLYFAGNKFKEQWLEEWLQNPVTLRPAGTFPLDHVKAVTDGHDEIVADSIKPHLKLSADKAKTVSAYLMTLKPYDNLLEEVAAYKPGNLSLRMGQMTFNKFNNCGGCHQDEEGYGGVSGPELYTAWDRLQPAFIASFIKDPVAWDPHTIMPHPELNDSAVFKLADYIKATGEAE